MFFTFFTILAIASSILLRIISHPSFSLIDPVAYHPKSPLVNPSFSSNDLLKKTKKVSVGKIHGAEDMVIGTSDGCMYFSSENGWIQRLCPNSDVQNWTFTDGRPLGMEWAPNGELIVCDAYKGLLSINKHKEVKVLATEYGGKPFILTDNVDVSSEGIIYFTDASDKYNLSFFHLDFLEARPRGRLLSFHPVSNRVELLLDGLYFANGVALSENEDFLLVAETSRYRIFRYWLKGPRAGQFEIFLDSLPGFPDNINSNRNGLFWIAFMKPRSLFLDISHNFPAVKRLIALIPKWILDYTSFPAGFIFCVNEDGAILKNLQDPWGTFVNSITGVREYQGKLYLTSLTNDYFGEIDLDLIE